MEWILTKLNFPSKLLKIVMACVSTIKFHILVNGESSIAFKPNRGLRQEDPLSPYFFILCVEGFSYLIKREFDKGPWKSIRMGHDAPLLTHLFFVDDF